MKINKGYELQIVCDEVLLTPIDEESDKRSISLDPLSADLWATVSTAENFTIETLVEALMQQYDVEEGIAREDCEAIARTWIEMGIAEP